MSTQDALLRELARAQAEQRFWGDFCCELERYPDEAHPAYIAYQDAWERQARLADMCVKARVPTSRLESVAAQAKMAARVLKAVMDRLRGIISD